MSSGPFRPRYNLTEAEWQRQVIQVARTFGWRVAHFRPSLRQSGRWSTAVAADGAGFPDLVLVHKLTGDLIFAELKRDCGKLRPEQEQWKAAIQAGGSRRFEVWRPRDFEAVRQRLMVHHEGPRPERKAA